MYRPPSNGSQKKPSLEATVTALTFQQPLPRGYVRRVLQTPFHGSQQEPLLNHCHCTHISTLPVHTLCITGSLEPLKYPALLISSKPTVLTLVLPERFWSLATAARVDRGSEDVPGERGRTSWDPHSKARQIVVCGTRSEP